MFVSVGVAPAAARIDGPPGAGWCGAGLWFRLAGAARRRGWGGGGRLVSERRPADAGGLRQRHHIVRCEGRHQLLAVASPHQRGSPQGQGDGRFGP
ncbi:MAG: hypothetical protein IV103_12200, partial [Zoogloea sp.]|nr:hypothetical protein [Zoogloea sp.]